MFVLDSDHVTLHKRGHPGVLSKVREVLAERVFSTVVTFEEQMRGWLAVVRRAREPEGPARPIRDCWRLTRTSVESPSCRSQRRLRPSSTP